MARASFYQERWALGEMWLSLVLMSSYDFIVNFPQIYAFPYVLLDKNFMGKNFKS